MLFMYVSIQISNLLMDTEAERLERGYITMEPQEDTR